MNKLAKYSAVGITGGVLFKMAHPNASVLITPFAKVPIPLAGAGIAVVASMVSEMVHAWILPHINSDKRLQRWEAALLTPTAGAVGFVGASYLSNKNLFNNSTEIRNLVLVGALSEVIGQWAYENFLLPLVDPTSEMA